MAAVAASDTASDAIFTNTVSRLAIYNSDTALSAYQANPVQVQRQITARGVLAYTGASSYVFIPNGTKAILLRRYYSSTDYDCIDWGRGLTTAGVGNGPSGGGRNLDTEATALGCTSGTYTSSGAFPGANDATGNFVSAANGLQRRTWSTGANLYVSYILV
jgi:hypothetical protein